MRRVMPAGVIQETTALSKILSPFDVREFFDTVLGRTMLRIAGNREKFSDLFSWSDLNRILAEHRLEPPRLRLAKKGTPPEQLKVVKSPRQASVLHRGMTPNLLDS